MVAVKKLILVTAEHHPYHSKWMNMVKELSNELGIDFEVKLEDYLFAIKYGITDELGMAGLPQLLAEFSDGSIKPLLYEVPLDSNYQADFVKAKDEVLKKIKEYSI